MECSGETVAGAGRRVVLASTSRHRRALMDRLGIEYEAVAPLCEEDLPQKTHPREGTLVLARRKASSIEACSPGCIIIGSDQMAVAGDEILHKPGSSERAVEQLVWLAGREHELWTSVVALETSGGHRVLEHVECWCMRMRALSMGEAQRYVERDVPLDCAGSYRFESLGVALFDSVEGQDPTAITGLPLVAVCRMLRALGVPIP